MAQLNPYLTFNGNCREAMNFYKDCLGGELNFIIVGESPVADQVPPGMKDAILHSSLKTGDLEIMATDMARESLTDGNTVHLCLVCKSEKEITELFEKLSAGGKVTTAVNEMFFGLIGELTDRYRKNWVLTLDKTLLLNSK
jgi:PhnB protein